MKKIIFTFATLLCTLSMNAQIVKLYNGNTLVKTYSKNEVTRVKFMNEGDAELISGITLSSTELSLNVGETRTLTATIAPSDASNQTLTWASSNKSVATVADGVVTAVGEGSATITATANDGSGISASCGLTAKHDYVDLGLSVKWATCNVGATYPYDYGDYFAWGETTGYNSGKTIFNWSTYTLCENSENAMTKYCTSTTYGTVDNNLVLESSDDVATAKWGSDWRMPTYDELDELKTECTWAWTTLNNVNGYKVTGTNGNYIFLPAAGYRSSDDLHNCGSQGSYWSTSLYSSASYMANYLWFQPTPYDPLLKHDSRSIGQSVRPVRK